MDNDHSHIKRSVPGVSSPNGNEVDPVLVQLKKLREGAGLSLERLVAAPAVLALLSKGHGHGAGAIAEPKAAFDRLVEILTRMPDTDQLRALVVDLGFDLEELLGRPATPREKALLGERRNGYAETIGRDVKTLARWSNKALLELKVLLEAEARHNRQAAFEGHLLITAGVQNRRLAGAEVMRYELSDTDFKHGVTESFTNPESRHSLPALLYQIPQTWKIHSVRFVVLFTDEQPKDAWALACDSVLDISFGNERFPLDIEDGNTRCRIDNPRVDQVYGVWWGEVAENILRDL